MGSGKSTLGPILANVLGYGFADLDARIAASAGMPVAQLFATRGEAAFRALEADALRATGREHDLVVATGGGALAREPNLSWARRHGTVVYLRATPEALAARLMRARAVRPLLLGDDGARLSEAALRDRIAALLAERRPFYEQAHVAVDVGAGPVGPAVDAVARALRHLRGAGRGA
jgi:shikimate kinase